MLWRRWCVGQCQKEITDIRQGVRTFHQGAALIFDCQKQTWGKNFILWYGYFLCDFFSNSKANNFSFSTWKYFVCMLKNVIQLFSMIFTQVWEITLSIRVLRRFFFLANAGVYTKNRNFRLYLSSKFGKKNPLLVAAENEFVPLSSMNDKAIFMDSLIANVK